MTPVAFRVDRWLNDPTRRFASRPVYRTQDLDLGIEAFVSSFLAKREADASRFPLSDVDLNRMVESVTSDFDSSCDLRFVGDDVEGATRFWFDTDPAVMIDRRLSDDSMRRRRRMTIAHELGHVLLHRQLFDRSAIGMMELFPDLDDQAPVYCFRHGIDLGPNWMEWQASYVAGLMLMPSEAVRRQGLVVANSVGSKLPFSTAGDDTDQLIDALSSDFEVSEEAVRVRLLQLHLIEPYHGLQALPLRE
jgi:hypothetical protein